MRFAATLCLITFIATSAAPASAQSVSFVRVMAADAPARPVRLPRGTFLPAPPVHRPPRIIPIPVPFPVVPAPPRIVQPTGHGKNALIGAVVGAGVGAVIGLAAPLKGLRRKDAAAVGALLFGGLGAYVGHTFDF